MKVRFFFLFLLFILTGFSPEKEEWKANFPKMTEYPVKIPSNDKVWIFIMAGQSNMAGRGFVEPQDTISNQRILTINKKGELVLAKEPLHFYEPDMAGLDCGVSFGRKMLKHIPDSVSILLIPAAVGGSSIDQWLGDSLHRNVKLLSNFKEKLRSYRTFGQIKGILWLQGESDAKSDRVYSYQEKLSNLFLKLRAISGNKDLPVMMGEIGVFSEDSTYNSLINNAIHYYATSDSNTFVIKTGDFKHRGDNIHFDSESQRLLGERYAKQYIQVINKGL